MGDYDELGTTTTGTSEVVARQQDRVRGVRLLRGAMRNMDSNFLSDNKIEDTRFGILRREVFSPASCARCCRLKCLAGCQCSRPACCDAGKSGDAASCGPGAESWSSCWRACWSWVGEAAGESEELFMCKNNRRPISELPVGRRMNWLMEERRKVNQQLNPPRIAGD